MQVYTQVHNIESLVFGNLESASTATVYLHGAGGFEKGATGQFEYEDFPSLLLTQEIDWPMPFICACAMRNDQYDIDELMQYLDALKTKFNLTQLHVIAYSRGGQAAFGLLERDAELQSMAVINSGLSESLPSTRLPVHLIHSQHDQRVSYSEVALQLQSLPKNYSASVWNGNHYSIAEMARHHSAQWFLQL